MNELPPVGLGFLEEITIAQLVVFISIVLLLFKYLRPALGRLRQFGRMLDTWFGDPRSTNPGDWGVLKRLEVLEQLKKNGGSSVKDKVDKIAEQQTVTSAEVTKMSAQMEQHLITSNAFWGQNILDRNVIEKRLDALEDQTYGKHSASREESDSGSSSSRHRSDPPMDSGGSPGY